MSNGDAGVPAEGARLSLERDFGKELSQASEVGQFVLSVTRERTENPHFRVRKYTMPMLDPRNYSQDAVKSVSKKGQITDEDIKLAKEASVALAVESAVQIVGARPTSNQVIEDSDSLEQMFRMVNRGAGLIIQTESTDQQAIVKAGRAALEKRKEIKGLEEANSWDDQKVVNWTKDMFKRAESRLKNSIDVIDAYHRR